MPSIVSDLGSPVLEEDPVDLEYPEHHGGTFDVTGLDVDEDHIYDYERQSRQHKRQGFFFGNLLPPAYPLAATAPEWIYDDEQTYSYLYTSPQTSTSLPNLPAPIPAYTSQHHRLSMASAKSADVASIDTSTSFASTAAHSSRMPKLKPHPEMKRSVEMMHIGLDTTENAFDTQLQRRHFYEPATKHRTCTCKRAGLAKWGRRTLIAVACFILAFGSAAGAYLVYVRCFAQESAASTAANVTSTDTPLSTGSAFSTTASPTSAPLATSIAGDPWDAVASRVKLSRTIGFDDEAPLVEESIEYSELFNPSPSGAAERISVFGAINAYSPENIGRYEFAVRRNGQIATSGVTGIHAGLLVGTTKVALIERWDIHGTNLTLNISNTQAPAWSSEFDFTTNEVRPLTIRSNVFCGAGSVLPDGRLAVLGGAEAHDATWGPNGYVGAVEGGEQAVRLLKPSVGSNNQSFGTEDWIDEPDNPMLSLLVG
ncbi:hypothetical protein HDU96_011069 [Phlyctochytrium bullatum]|nr:hypothetical protein HDU96_011069 [Phlyctochytrium bullatum]